MSFAHDRLLLRIVLSYFNLVLYPVAQDRLAWGTMFENFLSTKYTAAKRFGLEGGETLIPGMKVRHFVR
jgi:hypothetical protein